jgi:hypothetical protein
MRAGFAIKQSGGTIGRAARYGRPNLIDRIVEVMAICSRATAAAHFYEEHKAMSDAALAERGLERSQLSSAAFDKLTAAR